MKKPLALFFAFIITAQAFVHVGIGFYYHCNKAYITQELCENKNNPAMHCNGRCYLTKQLKKAGDMERKSAAVLKAQEEIVTTLHVLQALRVFPAGSQRKTLAPYAADITAAPCAFGITRPPEAA